MKPAKIRMKNLLLRTIIGINSVEREKKQDILINAEIVMNAEEAIRTDSPDSALNYRTITKEIIEKVEKTEFYLLESLVEFVIDIIMKNEGVLEARVEIDKPHALRFSESVSLERHVVRKRITE